MTRGEFDAVCEGRMGHALTLRKWNDTLVAGIISTMRAVAGVESERGDCMCYAYADVEVEPKGPMTDDEVVDVMKQWVTVTGGKTI